MTENMLAEHNLITIEDVAAMLAMTSGAVRIRLHRARAGEPTLPLPRAEILGHPLFAPEDIEDWAPGGRVIRRTRSDKGSRRLASVDGG